MTKVEFLDLAAQYKGIKPEIDEAISRVVSTGGFVLGKTVADFEQAAASFVGAKHGIGVNSGTDALYLALRAAGVKEGDEVITTPFTFIATAEVICWLNARPVLADICQDTLNIDPEKFERAITAKTKAVIPVHLYGQAADMEEILSIANKHNIKVIEDCAQSLGASYKGLQTGSFGHLAGFSFYPSKNLGAYGDGGLVLTSDEALAGEVRMLRQHGQDRKYHHTRIGMNSRLDALQAAVLSVKLKHLDKWNKMRREKAAYYDQNLKGAGDIVTPQVRSYSEHIYHQYTIRTRNRDALVEHLAEQGIPTAIHYPIPLHLQPAFSFLDLKPGSLPVAEKAAAEVVSLPIYPEISKGQQDAVVESITKFYK
jgi:dTDP-4-amino-4,6-dideoxygalactose transaminase